MLIAICLTVTLPSLGFSEPPKQTFKSIPLEMVERYKKLGFAQGGFEGIHGPQTSFLKEESVGANELPGFITTQFTELHLSQIDVPFGMKLNGQGIEDETNPKCKLIANP